MSELPKDLAKIVESGSMPSNIEVITDGELQDSRTIDPALYGFLMQAAQVGQLVKIRKAIEAKFARETFAGRLKTAVLAVTDRPRKLETWDWITGYFYNDGPNTAYISINDEFNWNEVRMGEDYSVDFTNAEDKKTGLPVRLRRVHHRCNAGNTASVRVIGKY